MSTSLILTLTTTDNDNRCPMNLSQLELDTSLGSCQHEKNLPIKCLVLSIVDYSLENAPEISINDYENLR